MYNRQKTAMACCRGTPGVLVLFCCTVLVSVFLHTTALLIPHWVTDSSNARRLRIRYMYQLGTHSADFAGAIGFQVMSVIFEVMVFLSCALMLCSRLTSRDKYDECHTDGKMFFLMFYGLSGCMNLSTCLLMKWECHVSSLGVSYYLCLTAGCYTLFQSLHREIMNNLSNSSFLIDTTTAANLKTFLMPLGAFVVVINACSTAALLRCKNMEAKMRQFAVCLTAIDICVGCHLMVMVFTYASNTTRNIVLCYTVLMMPQFMAYVGMLTTTAFAIDRFASIYRWHSYVITKQKTRAICGVVWLISFCTTAASFYGKRYTCDTQDEIDYDREINALLMIIPMLVCFVTIAVCYTAIYVNIRKHLSKTKDLGINRKEYAMTMFQSTVVTGILILAYLLCYGPISILKIYNYLYPETIVPTRTLRNVTQAVFVTNSLINPIIYAMRFRECRLELKHIFCFFNKVTRADIRRRKKILQAPFLEKGINVSPSTSKSNDAGPQSAYTINTHVCNSSNASPSTVHGNQPSERPAVPLPDDEHTTVEPSEHTVGVPQCLNPVSAVWTCRNYDDTLCVAEGFLSTDILKCPDDVVPACSKVIKVFPDSLSVPASTVPSNHIEYSTYNSTTFDESLV